MIILGWVVFSLIVGVIASDRSIGFWGGFLLSLFLSPIIGIIVTLLSDAKIKVDINKSKEPIAEATKSVADQLEKLSNLRNANAITEEEYQKAKGELLK